MRLLAVIAVFLGILYGATGRVEGADMKKYLFPADIKFQTIRSDEDADRLFTPPSRLHVSVKQPVIRDNVIIAEAELVNEGDQFVLVVNPYGGAFPYGGTSPFRISFGSPDVLKYSGQLYPPSPPMPLAITVPARSSAVFQAEINLDDYSWEGTPDAVIDWAFYYLKAPYPKGKLKIVLPKKIHRKPEPPIVVRP